MSQILGSLRFHGWIINNKPDQPGSLAEMSYWMYLMARLNMVDAATRKFLSDLGHGIPVQITSTKRKTRGTL